METGRLIRILKGHKWIVGVVKFSPDRHKLVSGSYDRTIKLWEVESGLLIRTLTGHSRFQIVNQRIIREFDSKKQGLNTDTAFSFITINE